MLAAESLCVGTAQLLAIFGSDLSAQQYGGLHQGVQPPDVIPPKTALQLVSSKHPVAGDQIPSQDAMMSWLKHVMGADDGHDAKSGFEIGLMLDVSMHDGKDADTVDGAADRPYRADRWADTMAALKIGLIEAPSSHPHTSLRQWWGLKSWPTHRSFDGLLIAPDRARLVEKAVADRRTGWTPASHRAFYHRTFREVVRVVLLVGRRIRHESGAGLPKLSTELWYDVCRHMRRRHWKPAPVCSVFPDA